MKRVWMRRTGAWVAVFLFVLLAGGCGGGGGGGGAAPSPSVTEGQVSQDADGLSGEPLPGNEDGTSAPDEPADTGETPSANTTPIPIEAVVGAAVSINGDEVVGGGGTQGSYTWTLVSAPQGSAAELSGADTPAPTLTPDKPGTYVIEAVVTDGSQEVRAEVEIRADDPPAEPAASVSEPEAEPESPPASTARQTAQEEPETVVVWAEDEGVVASTGSPETGWEEPERLGGTSVSGAPQVASDSTGTVLTLWPEGTRLVFTRQDADGGWIEPTPVVEGLPAPIEAVAFALNANGNGAVAWEAGDTVDIRGYAKPANSWNVLPPLDPGEGPSSGIRVGVDGSNRVLVVWVRDGTLWFSHNVLSEAPPAWPSPVPLDGGDEPVTSAELAVMEDGTALAVWIRGAEVRAAGYDPDAGWAQAGTLDRLPAPVTGLRLASDGEGNAVAVWAAGSAVRAAVRDPAEGWGPIVDLDLAAAPVSDLAAAMGDRGKAAAVWAVPGHGIRGASFVPDTGWTEAAWVQPGAADVSGLSVSVAADGTATVVWLEAGSEVRATWVGTGP